MRKHIENKESLDKIKKCSSYSDADYFQALQDAYSQMHDSLFKSSLTVEVERLRNELEDTKAIIKILAGQNNEYIGKIIKLKRELDVTDELLDARQKVLDAIPDCELHGSCIPSAMAWIEKMKKGKSKGLQKAIDDVGETIKSKSKTDDFCNGIDASIKDNVVYKWVNPKEIKYK